VGAEDVEGLGEYVVVDQTFNGIKRKVVRQACICASI
jgi:hypothetical protein